MSYLRTIDGLMLLGYHATTLEDNLSGGTVSCVYLIVSKDESCLIDTGITHEIAQEIEKMIDDTGCALKYIILTHDHYDHIANAGILKEKFGGKIVAHPLDVPMIENPLLLFYENTGEHLTQGFPSTLLKEMNMSKENWSKYRQIIENYLFFPQHVDKTVEDGQTLSVGDIKLTILHTPGHSPGSMSILNRATKSIYIGDLARGPGRPYPIGDVSSWEESLLKVKKLKTSFLGIGHSAPLRGAGRVRKFLLDKLVDLYSRETIIIKGLSENNALKIEELTDLLFPNNVRCKEYPNRDFTTYCHLLKIQREGITTQINKKGNTVWKLTTTGSLH